MVLPCESGVCLVTRQKSVCFLSLNTELSRLTASKKFLTNTPVFQMIPSIFQRIDLLRTLEPRRREDVWYEAIQVKTRLPLTHTPVSTAGLLSSRSTFQSFPVLTWKPQGFTCQLVLFLFSLEHRTGQTWFVSASQMEAPSLDFTCQLWETAPCFKLWKLMDIVNNFPSLPHTPLWFKCFPFVEIL